MVRYTVVNRNDDFSKIRRKQICEALDKQWRYDEKSPNLVISIGGDGTMLDACHQYMDRWEETVFIGMHTGTLGFYTDYNAEEWESLVNDLLTKTWQVEKRSLIEVDTGCHQYFALNEVRLEENHRTMVCDVYINDEYLECFRGNGLCISTPSGSTAYNRSLGGSVVVTSLPTLQLAEIAGIHHNAYRSLQSSLVLDEHSQITLRPQQSHGMILGIDRWTEPFDYENVAVKIKVSKRMINFAHFGRVSFCQRLRRSFISE